MTSADEGGRAQDQGRKHRRKPDLSPETSTLLGDWHGTLRQELRALVEALGSTTEPGLGLTMPTLAIPLDDPRRDRYVDRGVKVARELGTSIDTSRGSGTPDESSPRRRTRRVDFG